MPSSSVFWTLPNILSFVRLLGALVMPLILILMDNRLLAIIFVLIVFAFSALTDFADGYIARKTNSISKLGGVIDHSTDKVLVLATLVLIVAEFGFDPFLITATILIVIREITTLSMRLAFGDIPLANGIKPIGNRWKTALQMLALAALLGSMVLYEANIPHIHVYNTGIIMLWLSVILGFTSGWKYYSLAIKQ